MTALEVRDVLHVDRSTVYRMAEDGRLPAIRVGRSWRFPADQIRAMLPGTDPAERNDQVAAGAADGGGAAAALSPVAAATAVQVAADLLGVMMVATDMVGQPITPVANPCRWFAERADEPNVLATCTSEWRELAEYADLAPRFQTGALGFDCARVFIRQGTELVGMVLAGGLSPSDDPAADVDLHHLDESQRARVLAALPGVAAVIAAPAGIGARKPPATLAPGVAREENR